jgi:hypothetical protein
VVDIQISEFICALYGCSSCTVLREDGTVEPVYMDSAMNGEYVGACFEESDIFPSEEEFHIHQNNSH